MERRWEAIVDWSVTFTYGGTGERLKKVSGSQVARYVGGDYEIAPDGTVTKYLIGGKQVGTSFFIHHRDHLGSIQAVTDAAGVEVRRQDHSPFGNQHYASGSHAESKGWIGEREEETELVYLNARYYDPEIGRFASPDPIVLPGQLLNRYTYSSNNPINLLDPSGLFQEEVPEEANSDCLKCGTYVPLGFTVASAFFNGDPAGGVNPNPPQDEDEATISDDERINEAYRRLVGVLDSRRLSEEQRRILARAVWALSAPGVTVNFGPTGTTPDGNPASGRVVPGGLLLDASGRVVHQPAPNGLAVVQLDISLSDELEGIELAVALAHEGAHAAHLQEYYWELDGRAANPRGSAVDLTRYETEKRAYTVSAIAASALIPAVNDRDFSAGNYQILTNGHVQEGAINDLLENVYHLTPEVQAPRFSGGQ